MRLTTILLTAAAIAIALAVSQARPSAPVTPALQVPVRAPADAAQQPPERSTVGTLDRVDAAASEFVVNTGSAKETFHLQPDAIIRQGSKTIKPSELAGHRGERVKVRYRESGGVRRAEWIVVA